MNDSKIYSSGFCTFDNLLLTEVGEFSINKNPNINPVLTLVRGFAGINIGAGVCEVTIETAVPSADFEVNPEPFMKTGKEIEMGFVLAGRQMAVKMFITGANYAVGVGRPTSLSISLIGPLAEFE